MNRDFRTESPHDYPEPIYKYFVGVIESIDNKGILLTQATTGLKTYFFLESVIAIAEEELLDPDNPEDLKEIEKFKPVKTSGHHVNVDDIQQMNAELKRKFASDR